MSDNKLIAVLCVSSMVMGTIIMVNQETDHEKRMNLIKEKQALVETGSFIQRQETWAFCDSMRRVIDSTAATLTK